MPATFPFRSNVYWINLDPTLGTEIQKTRPCLILSSDTLNQGRRTVVVVPLSTTAPRNFLLHVVLASIGTGSQAVIHQLRTVDKSWVGDLLDRATLSERKEVANAVRMVLELD